MATLGYTSGRATAGKVWRHLSLLVGVPTKHEANRLVGELEADWVVGPLDGDGVQRVRLGAEARRHQALPLSEETEPTVPSRGAASTPSLIRRNPTARRPVKTAGISGAGYREIAQALRESIQSGELAPGALLPSESEVASRWTVSRVTARRALSALEGEGLIDTVAGRGRFVKVTGTEQKRAGSRAEIIADEIRSAITSGKIVAGARIESEAALSERYGVARGTAREALLILDREGLTTITQGRGRFVGGLNAPGTKNRAFEISESLLARIHNGDLPEGEPIPSEADLAQEFSAGRGTIRRALAILEEAGALIKRSGKARVVADVRRHNDGSSE
jgi:DNA-binding GntR family transcriptional regulator